VNSAGFWLSPAGQLSELRGLLTQARFTQARVETLRLNPPVACVLATRPADGQP